MVSSIGTAVSSPTRRCNGWCRGIRARTLAFQVDLWSARGDLPSDLNDVMSRQKDIQYSSRTRANTDHFKQIQCVRMALANLLEKIPTKILESDEGKLLRSAADRNVYQIAHLIYRSKNYEVQSKDYEFSRTSMIDHWNRSEEHTSEL